MSDQTIIYFKSTFHTNKQKAYLFLFLSFTPLISWAQFFDFNSDCSTAYNHIVSLRLEQGRHLLQIEKGRQSENLIPIYLESYIDFLTLFTSSDEEKFKILKENKDIRLSVISTGDKNSPFFLYTQAEIYLQWGIIKLTFREFFSAFLDLRRAYKLLEENINKHPDFKPNYKSLGLLKSLLGVIPSKYEWGIRLFGMQGNLKEGMTMLQTLLNRKEEYFFRDELIIVYASLLFHLEGKSQEAWEILVKARFPVEGNLLSYYTTAKIALYSKQNNLAIQILTSAPGGRDYIDFPLMEYYLGIAWLNQLDTQAIVHFKNFIETNQGKNLTKSAYQKIAWAYLIQHNLDQYAIQLNKAKENGSNVMEADLLADQESKASSPPDIYLLKARLLFDGGYLPDAWALLENKVPEDYALFERQLELVYRKGRILDDLKKEDEAINYYKQTIEMGQDAPYYYAANAALNLAYIYESNGNIDQAKFYYSKCMNMNNHSYKLSLNQKAKAGLQKLE